MKKNIWTKQKNARNSLFLSYATVYASFAAVISLELIEKKIETNIFTYTTNQLKSCSDSCSVNLFQICLHHHSTRAGGLDGVVGAHFVDGSRQYRARCGGAGTQDHQAIHWYACLHEWWQHNVNAWSDGLGDGAGDSIGIAAQLSAGGTKFIKGGLESREQGRAASVACRVTGGIGQSSCEQYRTCNGVRLFENSLIKMVYKHSYVTFATFARPPVYRTPPHMGGGTPAA